MSGHVIIGRVLLEIGGPHRGHNNGTPLLGQRTYSTTFRRGGSRNILPHSAMPPD